MSCPVPHLGPARCRAGAPSWLIASLFMMMLSCTLQAEAADVHAATSAADRNAAASNTMEVQIEDRELISLILGLTVAAVLFFNRQSIRSLPGARWWVAAFLVRLLAWILTVVEDFIWPDFLNTVEHLALMISTGLIAIAAWQTFLIHGEKRPLST